MAFLESMEVDPLYSLLTLATIMFLDKLNIVEDIVKSAKTVCKSIAPSQSHVFLAFYSLLSYARATLTSPLINGGDTLDIPYTTENSMHYNSTTVPFPIGLDPKQNITTVITCNIFKPWGTLPFNEVQLLGSALSSEIANALLNIKGNVTFLTPPGPTTAADWLTYGSHWVSVLSTSENLSAYLLNLNIPTVNDISSIQQVFRMYNASNNQLMANATRRFYNATKYNDFKWNHDFFFGFLGAFGGVGGLAIIGPPCILSLYSRFCKRSSPDETIQSLKSRELNSVVIDDEDSSGRDDDKQPLMINEIYKG